MTKFTEPLVLMALTAILVSAAGGSSAASEIEESNPCYGTGPNPCCIWQESGNCTVEDSKGDCNIYYTSYFGEGAYAPNCGDYLKAYMDQSDVQWMSTAITSLQSYAAAQGVLVANGAAASTIPGVAKGIVEGPWQDFDTDNGKCMGVGFSSGTYVGIYNCDSNFEKGLNHTGCETFRSVTYDADKYAAAVRNVPSSTSTACPDSTIDTKNEDETCAFNLFPDQGSLTTEEYDFTWAFNTDEPFRATDRGWWANAEKANGSVVFLDPYPNYDTTHPVFGYAAGTFVNGAMTSAAIVLQYLADNPCYLSFCGSWQESSDAASKTGVSKTEGSKTEN